jgi:hypothetical protein
MQFKRYWSVITLNAAGNELTERGVTFDAPWRLTEHHKRLIAERALAIMGLAGAPVEDVYGDNGEIYCDLSGTDSEDCTPVSLRITSID